MPRSRLSAVSLSLVLAAILPAQTVVDTGTNVGAGISSKNVVRDAAGTLYLIHVSYVSTTNHPVLLKQSTDGGQTWSTLITVNDAASGLTGVATAVSNYAALAIDDQGVVHCLYASYSGAVSPNPANFREYYRRYDPVTATLSPVVGILSAGVGATIRNLGSDIAVDGQNYVWITGQGPTTDCENLFVSQVPYAANDLFTDLGRISVSQSAQLTRICVDAAGWVHCTYYRNIAPGIYEHRIYVPGTGWQAPTLLGDNTPVNDYYGNLGADAQGNVHAVFERDTYYLGAGPYKFRYRRWNVATGWGPETTLFDVASAQWNASSAGQSGHYLCAMTVDEISGDTWAAYRDLSTNGALRVARKGLADAAFTNVPDVTPPSTAPYDTFLPAMRGSLYPASNNSTCGTLDITWQRRPQPTGTPFQWLFKRVDSAPTLALGAPPVVGTTFPLNIRSICDANDAFLCGFAVGTFPGIVLSDLRVVPLNFDDLLVLSLTPGNGIFSGNSGLLDGAGAAAVTIAVPNFPPLVGLTFYGAFVVSDLSNPTGIGTISPALPITLL